MAAINYKAIREAIRDTILRDSTLGEPGKNVTVEIEPGILDSVERTPWIGIYMASEDSPDPMQKLAAHSRLDSNISFVLVVAEHSLEGMPEATRLRDDIISRLSVALLKNSNLDGNVEFCYQSGVQYENGRDGSSCVALAFLDLVCKVQATT